MLLSALHRGLALPRYKFSYSILQDIAPPIQTIPLSVQNYRCVVIKQEQSQ
jgi:hypothetical protein